MIKLTDISAVKMFSFDHLCSEDVLFYSRCYVHHCLNKQKFKTSLLETQRKSQFCRRCCRPSSGFPKRLKYTFIIIVLSPHAKSQSIFAPGNKLNVAACPFFDEISNAMAVVVPVIEHSERLGYQLRHRSL